MEIPGSIKSTVSQDGALLTIVTPKTKSWPLIVLFVILISQSMYGLIRGFVFEKNLLPIERTILLTMCPAIIFLSLRGLLWQLKGKKILEIDSQKLVFKKCAPLKFRKKTYDPKAVKSVTLRNDTTLAGPLAMLQLLGITDRISIDFSYGYSTVRTLSGFNYFEGAEIKELIEEKIQRTKADFSRSPLPDHNQNL